LCVFKDLTAFSFRAFSSDLSLASNLAPAEPRATTWIDPFPSRRKAASQCCSLCFGICQYISIISKIWNYKPSANAVECHARESGARSKALPGHQIRACAGITRRPPTIPSESALCSSCFLIAQPSIAPLIATRPSLFIALLLTLAANK
jgi:hypothetical protein